MDAETLRQAVAQAGFGSLWIGLVTGFVFSFNPVALAAIPVSLAYVTKARTPRLSTLFGGLFVAGMILTHVALGLAASLGGGWVQHLLGRAWGLILGPWLIALGLIWTGWLRLPLPVLKLRAKRVNSPWGALALGVPFTMAVCPFCTPALIVLLGVAASVGSPLFGMALLLAFALGRAIPIMLGACAVGWLESLSALSQFQKTFERIGAILLILSGLYMLNAYFVVVPSLAA